MGLSITSFLGLGQQLGLNQGMGPMTGRLIRNQNAFNFAVQFLKGNDIGNEEHSECLIIGVFMGPGFSLTEYAQIGWMVKSTAPVSSRSSRSAAVRISSPRSRCPPGIS